ncbi:MAG: hypothetical protein OEU36_17735 [Gammaproteobacteria bacterium]|nr:hypothetical protein [Gammaproteobacteria bacterium]
MLHRLLADLNLSVAGVGYLVLVVLVAAVIHGYTGFGFSALVVSGASLALPPAKVVPTVLLLEVAASIHMLPTVWKDIDAP